MEPRNSERVRLPWYRAPVAWLGILVFAASIAGCVWIIVVSLQYRDPQVPVASHSLLGIPAHRDPAPAPASS